jgi:hypothetical protein
LKRAGQDAGGEPLGLDLVTTGCDQAAELFDTNGPCDLIARLSPRRGVSAFARSQLSRGRTTCERHTHFIGVPAAGLEVW